MTLTEQAQVLDEDDEGWEEDEDDEEEGWEEDEVDEEDDDCDDDEQ